MRVFNFSAGPSMLPMEVLEEAQRDFINYDGSGMSVCEMSHRSKYYEAINNECIALLKELMGIPEGYSVILVQGGASTQFEAIPLNLLTGSGKADYVVTGNFAKKAYKGFDDKRQHRLSLYLPKQHDIRHEIYQAAKD